VTKEELEVSDDIVASGGFGDVRIGMYMGGRVAVKTARVPNREKLMQIRKRFYREVILWERLSHPNVLKLLGVQEDMEKRQFVTVSEWMVHGNIMDYIKKNHANRLELLHGAAQGLKYLHGFKATHGDLKGANILVSNDTSPCACLADFGFITTTLDPGQKLSCSAQMEGSTMVFMAPELLVPREFQREDAIPTPQADIYAFGMVIFQVLTGEIPFRGVQLGELICSVVRDKRWPDKPKDASAIGFSDPLWSFVQRCWDGDAKLRPDVGEVVTHVWEAAVRWDGLMPPCAQAENVTPDPEDGGWC